jgi:hypothetical protein
VNSPADKTRKYCAPSFSMPPSNFHQHRSEKIKTCVRKWRCIRKHSTFRLISYLRKFRNSFQFSAVSAFVENLLHHGPHFCNIESLLQHVQQCLHPIMHMSNMVIMHLRCTTWFFPSKITGCSVSSHPIRVLTFAVGPLRP